MTQFTNYDTDQALVSVVITNYNHGKYLATAINSVLHQNFINYELIVVDDGSTDNSRSVVEAYPAVKYIYQENQGLSAARNTGIKAASGNYLVFLDADDWLYKDALSINVSYLSGNSKVAFVSGAHQKIDIQDGTSVTVLFTLNAEPYQQLLQGNYIGMHATVMYCSWVLREFTFDTSLRGCEDYDIYLRIARKYRVIHHQHVIAAYMHHGSNMSFNHSFMLQNALKVLHQYHHNDGNAKEDYKAKGLLYWKAYYTNEAWLSLNKLPLKKVLLQKQSLHMLYVHNRPLYIKIIIKKVWQGFKSKIKSAIRPHSIYQAIPPIYRVDLGSLNRTQPFSTQFGYDRGGPVDRYYIEKFLAKNSHLIKGRALEIGDNEYTLHFGGSNVSVSDILHVDRTNKKATYVGDLSNAPNLPSDAFDCIILTQTLQFIYDFKKAIATCYRILKPGGSLLLTVPGISHIPQDEWGEYCCWSFTETAMKKILSERFDINHIQTETYGNVLVASAFLYGMGRYELSNDQLNDHDPHYQVIITAECKKPGVQHTLKHV